MIVPLIPLQVEEVSQDQDRFLGEPVVQAELAITHRYKGILTDVISARSTSGWRRAYSQLIFIKKFVRRCQTLRIRYRMEESMLISANLNLRLLFTECRVQSLMADPGINSIDLILKNPNRLSMIIIELIHTNFPFAMTN